MRSYGSPDMKPILIWGSVLLSGGIATMGCLVEEPFAPTDGSVVLQGEWSIGDGPASTATCGASGIASVELRLFDPIGSEYVTNEDQISDCATGVLTTSPRFQPDTYRVQWIVTDGSGETAWSSVFETITAVDGETARVSTVLPGIPPSGFNPRGTAVTLTGAWQIDGAVPTEASCAENGIATVQLVFSQGDEAEPYTDGDFIFACESGTFVRPNSLSVGTFKTRWRARDALGNVLFEDDAVELAVRPGNAIVPIANFPL